MNSRRVSRAIPLTSAVEWDREVTSFSSHDTYHLSAYHRLAERNDEGTALLYVFELDGHRAACPMLVRDMRGVPGCDTSSLYDAGSAYGYPGLIASIDELAADSPTFRDEFQRGLVEELGDRDIVALFVRQHPLAQSDWLFDGLASPAAQGRTVAIDLTLDEAAQVGATRKTHRHDLRKAARLGIECEHDVAFEHLDTFSDIYLETMQSVDASEYYRFDRAYFRDLRATLDGHLLLFHARHEGEIVASALFLVCNGTVQYHLGGQRSGSFPVSATRTLLDTVRRWATRHGYRRFHLGGGVGSGDDQLFRFKAGFSTWRPTFTAYSVVLDEQRYSQLCGSRDRWCEARGLECVDSYFPRYRSPIRTDIVV